MSVQEHRRIMFGLPALRDAFQGHLPDIAPDLVPRGAQVKGVAVLTDPLRARIRVLPPGAAESHEVEVSLLHIGAAMIRRSKVLGIPLPRQGSKAIEGTAEGITMLVSLTHEAKGQSQLSAHRVSA